MEGSLRTMPRPWANTQVFAVPRSMAMSLENIAAIFMVMSRRTARSVPSPFAGNTHNLVIPSGGGITKRSRSHEFVTDGAGGTNERSVNSVESCMADTYWESIKAEGSA